MAKALTVQSVDRLKPSAARREVPDGLLPGLYLVIQPSGARSWAVRYRHGGRPRKLTLGPFPALDLGVARGRARAALQAAAEGKDPAQEKQESARQAREGITDRDSFDGALDAFLRRHVEANTKARSAAETKRIFDLHVRPKWKGRALASIRRRDVAELLDGLVDAGKPVLANRTLAAVRKFFNWCVDREWLDASPCARLKAPTSEESRDRVLSDAELRLIWLASERAGWPFGPMVRLLMLTGQRRDEAAGASRSEIIDGVWTIPAPRTKNGRANVVPLPPAAIEIVESLPSVGDKGWLFTTGGERPVSGFSRAKARLDRVMIEIARKEAEAAGADPDAVTLDAWRLHDLRRTMASGLARMATPPHVVEAILNHKSGEVSGVAAIYNRHSYLPEKRAALIKWAEHISRILGSEDENGARS